jgi:hypothetical protein
VVGAATGAVVGAATGALVGAATGAAVGVAAGVQAVIIIDAMTSDSKIFQNTLLANIFFPPYLSENEFAQWQTRTKRYIFPSPPSKSKIIRAS